ncbi:MAG: NF038122 family metalloprotease [Methylocystis sp.]
MQINLIYDSSTASAPAAFFTAMNYCVQYLDSLITNNITVNIEVGWGEIQGQSLGAGVLGEGNISGATLSYAQLKADLLANSNSAADASAYANLPSADISHGAGFYVSLAQEKAWGLIPADGTEIDGYVGFSDSVAWTFDPNNQAVAGDYDFIGDALHELTHALGRDSGLNATWPDTVMDLFQYSSAGTLQTHHGGASYFSINGGVTDLADFSSTSDLGDWSTTVPNDSFDAYSNMDTAYSISETDITLLNILGFSVTPQHGSVSSVNAATDDSVSEVGIGHVVTITLNTAAPETVTGTPTLRLNDGEAATYVGGSGTSALQFAYTVQPSDNTSDLSVTGLSLTGGATILDALDNSLSTSVTANLGVQIITLVTNLSSSEDSLVYLMYQAAYDRVPDYAGFTYWAGQADARQLSALQLADIFMAAPEFTAAFGSNPSNDAYVSELYANVLGRTPDAVGLAYWEAQANAGQARDQLLVDFATSPENLALTTPHTANGFWVS